MIPKTCKRLAEVDFPIAEVSRHSAREKSIRHGHPSTLHLWWARRPLAACRAMLLGLLLPDPCDEDCPEDFRAEARSLLGGSMLPWKAPGGDEMSLRASLLSFIAEFANWDNSANEKFLETARGLVKAAHPEETPLVVDPFAGGGSIPLEALRVGCEAFASDLNPVACLILKVMLEDIPRHGPGLADELRRVGAEIKKQAEKELAEFYPKDPDGATPIAYLWARTVRCESPKCGAEIPLMRSFWLCKKKSRKRALRCKVIRPKGKPPRVEFEVFEPKNDSEVHGGTVTRAKATCLCCGTVLPPERVRTQLSEQRGGADVVFDGKGRRTGGALMTAVVTLHTVKRGRGYREASGRDYLAIWEAQKRLRLICGEWEGNGEGRASPIPDELISRNELRRISVPLYGMETWGDIFSARQKLALVSLVKHVRDRSHTQEEACQDMLALVVDRCADYWSSLCSWHLTGEKVNHTFGRQALGMVWDYCEVFPYSGSSGNYDGALEWGIKAVVAWVGSAPGQIQAADAAKHPLPDETADVWFTDPPYYDAVPYAHLSDFFYVWLQRALSSSSQGPSREGATPKDCEIVVDRPHGLSTSKKDVDHYERGMGSAFAEGRRILLSDGIGSVVFAHKTTEGWESLLTGMITGGWTITGSWPVATEMGARLNARDTASLATSVHLVCCPRPEDAPVGDWTDVLRELPPRVADWMERLQGEGVRGADLVFACIGPALEIFSRYRKVETAEGDEVKLAVYLEKVWEVVGRAALEQVLGTAEAVARNGAAGAVEEDARLTALFLWTLQATEAGNGKKSRSSSSSSSSDGDDEEADAGGGRKSGGFSLVFDVVRRFAQPLGIDLPKWEGRVIETQKGVVRLMAVSERSKQLFGGDGAEAVADWIEEDPARGLQGVLFPELEEPKTPQVRGRRGRGKARKAAAIPGDVEMKKELEATTLDRVHAAMLLQAGGQANALRQLIKAEADRGPDFLRLANALSALYPMGSEEKRLLDAMLLAVPR